MESTYSKRKNEILPHLLGRQVFVQNVNEEEFNIIWNKLYTSYWKEELTYTEVSENPTYQIQDHSY